LKNPQSPLAEELALSTLTLSREQALTIINALRSGTVPPEGLEHYAVGLEEQMKIIRNQRG